MRQAVSQCVFVGLCVREKVIKKAAACMLACSSERASELACAHCSVVIDDYVLIPGSPAMQLPSYLYWAA